VQGLARACLTPGSSPQVQGFPMSDAVGLVGQASGWSKVRAGLELVRIANVFTAVADVVAGYLLVMGAAARPGEMALLAMASAALYGGGCALNDYRDRLRDVRQRPGRPLPSGRLSLSAAVILASALLTAGPALAWLAAPGAGAAALLLLGMILFYNLAGKGRGIVGPLAMGSCRGLNLAMGFGPGMASLPLDLTMLPLLTLLYVFALSRLGRVAGEDHRPLEPRLVVLGLWLVPVLFLAAWLWRGAGSGAVIFLICFIVLSGVGLLPALARPGSPAVGRGVGLLIMAIVLLDATYVAAVHGWLPALPVAALLVPVVLLGRHFAMD
jgi:4-hydroxybenzoate polyprenyltransferase